MENYSNNDLLKALKENHQNILDIYINNIEQQFKVNINIHDVAGISAVDPILEKIFLSHKYHDNPFCNYVKKSNRCFNQCVINKEKLCKRCNSTSTPFYGSCYMGVEEIVYPIMYNEKLMAIISIGQFYSDIEKSKRLIRNNALVYGLPQEETEKKFLMTSSDINFNIKELNIYILMLIDHILLLIQNTLEKKYNSNYFSNMNIDILTNHKNSFIINNTLEFIKDNYNKELSLNLLASNSYCNHSYLSHIFKEEMNIGITEYINTIRIQAAKELLDITSKSITEICMKVGFNDLGYFGKVFKSVIGLTPKEYRERNT